ncbi:class I adenylate-forming enzyme family protein [Desulfosediminicola flagellatus]|uniref:class I adenylate-forming enzyme family protein n=1 Tax=Desulfosediminicola flagellatus TaxID=2569541 RepID=UPI0010ACBE19|nr:AMP-binding protein [Desulfosediminicola flagellatus]
MNKTSTLKTMLARGLEHSREKLAIVEGGKQCTFKVFAERTYRIGNALLGLDLEKGERVAVLSRNSMQSAELFFAIPNIGLVVTMINYRLAPSEIMVILADSKPSVLVVNEEYADSLDRIRKECSFIKHIICFGDTAQLPAGTLDYELLIEDAAPIPVEIDISEDDIAALMYTSGTTGIPKGCIATHRNLYHVGRSVSFDLRMDVDDVAIIPVPIFHASGAALLFNGIYSGTTSIIMPYWNFKDFSKLAQAHQVTTTMLVTPMLESLVNCQEAVPVNFKRLKKVMFVGAPSSLVVFEKALQLYGNIFVHGYGATETLGSVCILRTDQIAEALSQGRTSVLGSCGKSSSDMLMEVVDEDGHKVSPGVQGEIRVKGLGVTQGYWRKELESERAFRDGWYYTEDFAKVDEQGFVYIVGRKKDMIITGGENVFPAEVENIIYKHPAVAEAAVVGIGDKTWGEAVTAVIVKKPGMDVTDKELIAFCRNEIAGYKVPKTVIFTESLPTSITGKLQKGKLRERISQMAGQQISP